MSFSSRSIIFLTVSLQASSYFYRFAFIASISDSSPLTISSCFSFCSCSSVRISPLMSTSFSISPAASTFLQSRVPLKNQQASGRWMWCSKWASPWSFSIASILSTSCCAFWPRSYSFCFTKQASSFSCLLIIWVYIFILLLFTSPAFASIKPIFAIGMVMSQEMDGQLDQQQQDGQQQFYWMDQILENSYFHTNIKNKYSFPKSDRFPDLKSKYTIDFYESSSMQKPRSTTFGYGSKYDFFRDTKKGPSPFDYSLREDRLTQGLSFGRGRQEVKANSYIDLEKIKTPRAGEYNDNFAKVKKREPSCCMIGRQPQDSFIQPNTNPEPSKYNPVDSFYSRRKKSAEFAFGSARRFDYGEGRTNKMVGPGSYAISPSSKSKLGTIGHATRKTYAVEEIEKSISPGPKYIVK